MRERTGPGDAPPVGRPARVGGLVRPLLSLLAAAACTAAVVALVQVAVGTASGQRLDQLILSGAGEHEGPLAQYAELAVETVSVPVVAVMLALAVLLVLLRRRPGLLLPLGSLVLGANLSTQVIKHVLVTREALGPGIDITPNSFPSGHTSAALAAACAWWRTLPRRWMAVTGLVLAVCMGLSRLYVGVHYPSDVLAVALVGSFCAWMAWKLGEKIQKVRDGTERGA